DPSISCRSLYAQRPPSVRAGFVMGSDLLLWNVLVADVSDDPLCSRSGVGGLSALFASGSFSRSIPGGFLSAVVPRHCPFWYRGDFHRSAYLDFARVGALCDNRTTL